MSVHHYDFQYAPTLQAAFECTKPVKIVQGPVESGKTVWLCLEIYAGENGICTIPRGTDGIRRSRHLVIRSTEGELERGIMRTWRDLFPEEIYGDIQGSMPAIHKMKFLDVEAEVEFFAFEDDSEKVLKKLRSTEYTTVNFNEGQFTQHRLFLAGRQRAGRFPRRIDCPSYNRKKICRMDMNAPRTNDHWVPLTRKFPNDPQLPPGASADDHRKYRKPDDWEFFMQPGVVLPVFDVDGSIKTFEINPEAENLPYQQVEEILAMCATGDIDDIKRDYMNLLVIAKSGTPRYPDFKKTWHVAKERLRPVKGVPPIIGYDPSLNGGATFWQKINNQWRGYFEMNARTQPNLRSARKQGDYMLDVLKTHFPWYTESGVVLWGDPYGDWASTDETETYYTILGEMGLQFRTPAKKDNPHLRHETGKKLLAAGEYGSPRLLICPVGMPTFLAAIDGGAVMQTVKRDGDMVMESKLKKNNHADVMESAEYAWWGGGENYSIVETPAADRTPPKIAARSSRSPFSRVRARA